MIANQAAAAITPDPSTPAYLHRRHGVAPSGAGKRWVAHHERRSMILAAVRNLIAEQGAGGICLRAIADQCGISVPTIYNIVGDRRRVMNEAAAEWVEWLAYTAVLRSDGAVGVLTLLETFWTSAIDHPDYTANAVKIAVNPEAPLNHIFRATGTSIAQTLLDDLQLRGSLRPSIDAGCLAWHLIQAVHSGVCNWIAVPCDPARFHREFAWGPGMMLLGALRGHEVERVECRLKEIETLSAR